MPCSVPIWRARRTVENIPLGRPLYPVTAQHLQVYNAWCLIGVSEHTFERPFNRLRLKGLTAVVMIWGPISCGMQIPVKITSVPPAAETVLILADGDELSSPLGSGTHGLKGASTVELFLPAIVDQALKLRAVAFSGSSVFPNVSAIGVGYLPASGQAPAKVALGWPQPTIETIGENSRGSMTILASFGETDFFRQGEVAELWISNTIAVRNCAGTYYLAPLSRRGTVWKAQFEVPTRLLSTSTSFQLAYRALDFALAGQVPLLVWPNLDKNEPPLRNMSSANPRSGDSSPSLPQPEQSSVPDSYIIKPGRDGRLTRIRVNTGSQPPSQ